MRCDGLRDDVLDDCLLQCSYDAENSSDLKQLLGDVRAENEAKLQVDRQVDPAQACVFARCANINAQRELDICTIKKCSHVLGIKYERRDIAPLLTSYKDNTIDFLRGYDDNNPDENDIWRRRSDVDERTYDAPARQRLTFGGSDVTLEKRWTHENDRCFRKCSPHSGQQQAYEDCLNDCI